jgi:aminopeptidase N
VILDFRGPKLVDVSVNGTPIHDPEWNGAHLRIPARSLTVGTNAVDAHFTTLIAPAGWPIIRFHDETDGRDYLYTLLVPSDAHALFPCFDQPDLKARLTLQLTVPSGWTAIANGRPAPGATSPTVFRFAESDPLPTYLLAFAAGPYTRFSEATKPHLWVRASRAREVEVDSLQTQVASAIGSLQKYFGVPYPFQQFQYMLSPAFPFGGMEHPGVTMFNEESFIYREPPTLTQRLGRRATIYHEVAHHWFATTSPCAGSTSGLRASPRPLAAKRCRISTHYRAPVVLLRNKPAAYDVALPPAT